MDERWPNESEADLALDAKTAIVIRAALGRLLKDTGDGNVFENTTPDGLAEAVPLAFAVTRFVISLEIATTDLDPFWVADKAMEYTGE